MKTTSSIILTPAQKTSLDTVVAQFVTDFRKKESEGTNPYATMGEALIDGDFGPYLAKARLPNKARLSKSNDELDEEAYIYCSNKIAEIEAAASEAESEAEAPESPRLAAARKAVQGLTPAERDILRDELGD